MRGEAETGGGGAVPGIGRIYVRRFQFPLLSVYGEVHMKLTGSLVTLSPGVTGPAAPAFGPCRPCPSPWPGCPCPNWAIPNGLDGLFSFSEFFLLRFRSGGEGLFAVDVVGVEAD